jgi:hypothetical protein
MLFVPIAIGLVAATVWYGFVWVPSQKAYFTDRDLRQLAILENQIKQKIEGFDRVMDNIPDNPPFSLRNKGDKQSFFHDLKIGIEYQEEDEVDDDVRNAAHDPPSVKMKPDEGAYYLFLAFHSDKTSHGHAKHRYAKQRDGARIFAKAKINDLIKPFVSQTDDFDAILVAQANGRVIFQSSGSKSTASGLEFTRIDDLLKSETKKTETKESRKGKDKQEESDDQEKGDRDKDTLERVSEFSSVSDVELAGKKYIVFSQPIHLSFPTVESVSHPPEKPEEWVLCGLVASDRFNSNSLAVPYSDIIWFSAVLLLLLLSHPFLKVLFVSPKGRLRRRDAVLLTVSTILGTGFLTLFLLDLFYSREFSADVQQSLRASSKITTHN